MHCFDSTRHLDLRPTCTDTRDSSLTSTRYMTAATRHALAVIIEFQKASRKQCRKVQDEEWRTPVLET